MIEGEVPRLHRPAVLAAKAITNENAYPEVTPAFVTSER
jgi:hypothetical protein